jgi:hypothetical protein
MQDCLFGSSIFNNIGIECAVLVLGGMWRTFANV